ncbi:MBOAT family protein [Lutibacter sp. HS1-25]|uniref:MBOAT family O-acyltransferase n=1 Tax=Lutibacter sp. HS1-25 TaxID=2485000 RepID=UPI0010104F20|nr:MBOAT family O-acyltransferase [Lutibacter sp. HS1-25]RXP46861.1 MBOAT family protein [Lutibacter sp. HS1-25]
MIFTSKIFLLVAIVVLILNLVFRRVRQRQLIFLLASYTFYVFFDFRFFWLLLVISLISFIFGILIYRKKSRFLLTFIGIALIIFFIAFFKLQLYFNFTNSADKILLPLGISFYSFQAISYLVDVYRGKLLPEKKIIVFLLYISFFPQLVAGPIERGKNLIPQITRLPFPSNGQIILGLKQIVYGYFLKIVVSDNLNDVTFLLLNDNFNISKITGLILFYFQIYFDFHGYTNIAVGLANIFGIKLNQNFRLPFLAKSIKDFWHRWHISLSTWFKDYLYIPLGGSKSKNKSIVILIVFSVSGVWHGPTYNFLLWGVYNGIIYLVEDMLNRYIKIKNKTISTIVVFFLISFGWLFFYYNSLDQIKNVLLNLIFGSWENSFSYLKVFVINNLIVLQILILAIYLNINEFRYIYNFNAQGKRMMLVLNYFLFDILIVLIILFGFLGNKEFVYFRF